MRYIRIKKFLILLTLFILSDVGELKATQNNNILYVYDEYNNIANYLWFPSGWMNQEGISFKSDCKDNCYKGNTCNKISFNFKETAWMGIYWLPDNSWEGPGINLYEQIKAKKGPQIKLTFWTRGERGGEMVQFKVGGVSAANDSISSAIATKWICLSTDWRQCEIDLSKADLSNVVGGFCCVTKKIKNTGKDEIVFFLDDIRYEAN